jgi:1,2-diacylglycerol 3-alpha-glucosyltransferase
LKTAIISTTFHAHQGADRVMWQLAERLSGQGEEVTVFTFSRDMEPPPGVNIVDMGMPRSFMGERFFHLLFPLHICKANKYTAMLREFDRIYTGPYPSSWLAYLAKRRYGKPYTYYFYHFNLPGFIPGLAARIYTSLHVFAEKWTLKRAAEVITISNFSRESLKGVFKGPVTVEYCKVDRTKFRPGLDGSTIRTRYGLGDAPLVLCVGQLIPSKGMHLLIEAFMEVRRHLPQAKLLIIGKAVYPGYANRLRKMADSSVIFIHDVSDDEMPLYYTACDVYATATLWEGFNIPLVEAQACGKPVVAFNIGPHPEVVLDQFIRFMVPALNVMALAEKIISILQDSLVHSSIDSNTASTIKNNPL